MPELEKNDMNELKKALADGYKEMSSVNLALAEEALSSDNKALLQCEQILAECE